MWGAIQLLRADPLAGLALRDELTGLWRFRVGRLRIVYRFDATTLELILIGRRETIYEDLARRLRRKR